jgi:hypothetical protein
MTDDIIDGIDQLVDDQIASGEWSAPGRVNSSAEYPRCSHCDREWHGLPIIDHIAKMHKRSEFDEGDRTETDDSRVLCRGSDYIGPMPFEHAPSAGAENSEAFQLPEWWPAQVSTRRPRPSCDPS